MRGWQRRRANRIGRDEINYFFPSSSRTLSSPAVFHRTPTLFITIHRVSRFHRLGILQRRQPLFMFPLERFSLGRLLSNFGKSNAERVQSTFSVVSFTCNVDKEDLLSRLINTHVSGIYWKNRKGLER